MKFNKKIKNLESEWFGKNSPSYQEICIPISLAKSLELKHDSKVAVKVKCNTSIYTFPARVSYRIKKDGNCFRFYVPKDIQNNLFGKILLKVIKLQEPSEININECEIDLAKFPINTSNKTQLWSDEFGVFRLDDSRQLTLSIHNWLIQEVLKLGDTNKQIFEEWKNICKKLGLNYSLKIEKSADSVYVRFRDYYSSVMFYKSGIFNEYGKRRAKLLKGLRNSVESYIALQLFKSDFNPINLKGKFGSKTPSFFYVNKGGALVENNLISVKDKTVFVTDKGKEFIKELVDLKILEVD